MGAFQRFRSTSPISSTALLSYNALLNMDRGKVSTPKALCLIRRYVDKGGAEVIRQPTA